MRLPAAFGAEKWYNETVKQILQFPKLLVFFGSVVIAYALYRYGAFHWIEGHLDGASYLSLIVAGFLFSFGFTAPFATAYFIEVAHLFPPLVAAPLAALGTALSDMGIFQFTLLSLHDEILRFKTTRLMRRMYHLFHHESIPEHMRKVMRWVLACLVIATPLPDEIGMTIVVGFTQLKGWRLSLLCFALNMLGIFVILELARSATS